MTSVLVVAGEASGDRAAAPVVARLVARGVDVFGMGGRAMLAAGADLVARLEDTTAVGVGEVARRAFSIASARTKIELEARRRKPAAALLVDYTEFNTTVARTLKPRGVRVLWYVAPQIWAWRPGRASSLAKIVDRVAVILPFEEALWRAHGVDARYVGHPALEDAPRPRTESREKLGLTQLARAVAILPGSRPHEVRRLLTPMLEAYEIVRRDHASLDARLMVASSLDPGTRAWAQEQARSRHIGVTAVDATRGAYEHLAAFDAALCASGTASLEAALAGATPIVAYRVGLATELIVRPLITTPHIALPNVLLGRRAFPELLQRKVRTSQLVRALESALGKERSAMVAACAELLPLFGDRRRASFEVAAMLEPWL